MNICSMTWTCTSINTRWSSDPSRSLFEVYLDKLDKDLQHLQLQEPGAYINVQKSIFATDKVDDLGDTLTHYGSEPQ